MIKRTYRINDVVSEEFLRMPLSLLANPNYRQMSLEAKFVYSLLLNRMTLSQKNDWINEENEVYLIYTREEAANTLNISYKKAIAAFKELIEAGLLYEERQGRGYPNLLYVLKAELSDNDAAEFSEEFNAAPEQNEPENAENTQMCRNGISRHAETAHQELPKSHIKTCQNGTSRTDDTAGQDMPNRHTSNIYNKNTEINHIEKSQSVSKSYGNFSGISAAKITDGPTDSEAIQKILDRCELEIFSDGVKQMLIQAVERLYYSESLKIGNARLPQATVRSYLNLLDSEILIQSVEKMRANEEKITNPTAYIMSTIINAICEKESDLILSLPAEYVRSEDLYATAENICDLEEGENENDSLYTGGSADDSGFCKSIQGNP